MKHRRAAAIYMGLAADGAKLEQDQRSLSRKAFMVVCAALLLLSMPLLWATAANAGGEAPQAVLSKSGPGSGGDEDNSGPGGGDDDNSGPGRGDDDTGTASDTDTDTGGATDTDTRNTDTATHSNTNTRTGRDDTGTRTGTNTGTGRDTRGATDRGNPDTGLSTHGETDPGDKTGKTERRSHHPPARGLAPSTGAGSRG